MLRDLKADPKKTAVLGGLSLVAAYVCGPPLLGLWSGGSEDAPDLAAAPPPIVPPGPPAADPSATAAASGDPRATSPATPGTGPLDPAAVRERLASDRRLRSAGPDEPARDPFTPVRVVAVAAPDATTAPATRDPDKPTEDAPTAAEVAEWAGLSAILGGAGGGVAVLGGRAVPVGGPIELGGRRFVVRAAAGRSVTLVLARDGRDGRAYTLALPPRVAPGLFTAAATRPGGTVTASADAHDGGDAR